MRVLVRAWRHMRHPAWDFAADESGVMAPLFVLMSLVLLAFCALALDTGRIYANRRDLQNAADAAALAGARELQLALIDGTGDATAAAQAKALSLAVANGVNSTVTADCQPYKAPTLSVNQAGVFAHSWEVEVTRLLPLNFGKAVGMQNFCIRAQSVAVVTELRTFKIWPWAMLKGTLGNPPQYNQLVTLKEAAQGSSSGNFGILDFNCGGGGATTYQNWIYSGFGTQVGENVPGPIPPNTWSTCTETGNKSSANKDLAKYVAQQQSLTCPYGDDVRCPLIGMVPILKENVWPNGTKQVTVTSFAIFQLEDIPSTSPGQMQISGMFLQYAGGVGPTYVPDPTGALTGLIGVRLWR